nr:latent-transforming growth factor beta-binding protein 2-like [Crassostrea gigas]
MSFMTGEHGCRFIPWNISSNIETEYISENSSTGELCMVFMALDYSFYALSQINNVHVKYESFGRESNIRIAEPPCSSVRYLQNVDLILMCQRKKVLGDSCQIHEQCKDTPNAGVCMADPQNNVPSSCQCNPGFMTYNGTCLQVNKTLYEECVIDDQCNGTSDKEALVCREIRHRKLCMCNSDYIEDNTYLECRHAKKEIRKECRINEQCTGTENANTCFTDGKGEGEEGVCTCNDQFDWIDGKCLKVGLRLLEPCIKHKQCNGTDNTDNCTEIGNNTLCYCRDGYLIFEEKCIKGITISCLRYF